MTTYREHFGLFPIIASVNLLIIFITIQDALSLVYKYTYATTGDDTDDVKDSFYEELERAFNTFPKYHNENFVRRFQCQSSQGRHFQTDIWE
jgi:hypothetical protein